MFIGMLHYAAPPIVGGVEAVIAHHAAGLVAQGYRVEVIAGRGGRFHPQVQMIQVPLVDSRAPENQALKVKLDAGEFPQTGFNTAVSNLREVLLPYLKRYDALIVHNALTMPQNLPLTALLHQLATMGELPRLIAWHHDLAWHLPRYQNLLHPGYPWDLLRTPSANTVHVTVSATRRHALMDLMKLSETQVHVVPGGVDAFQYWGLDARISPLLNDLDVFNAEPVLLLPARLTRRKNVQFAIEVCSELRRYYARPVLIVTGPSDPHNPGDIAYFADLRQLVKDRDLQDNIWLLAERLDTPPSYEEVVMLYRSADAMILPSLSEGFGLPMLEAALMRLPIFCSDIPPLRETGDSEAFYFARDASPAEVADLIYERMTEDRAFRLRRRILNGYDWRQIVGTQLIPLLRGVDAGV